MNHTIGRWLKAGALMFVAVLVIAACEGPTGLTGKIGPKGDTGDLGLQGLPGMGVVSITDTTADDGTITLTITFTSGDPVVVAIPPGTAGDAGDAGRGIANISTIGPDENGILTITITYNDDSDPTVLEVDIDGTGDKPALITLTKTGATVHRAS